MPRLGDSHDALNDSGNLRRLTKKMVEELGYGTSENAVLQVLRSHKSVQMNKPSCENCCASVEDSAVAEKALKACEEKEMKASSQKTKK